jgi:hypothetical protein
MFAVNSAPRSGRPSSGKWVTGVVRKVTHQAPLVLKGKTDVSTANTRLAVQRNKDVHPAYSTYHQFFARGVEQKLNHVITLGDLVFTRRAAPRAVGGELATYDGRLHFSCANGIYANVEPLGADVVNRIAANMGAPPTDPNVREKVKEFERDIARFKIMDEVKFAGIAESQSVPHDPAKPTDFAFHAGGTTSSWNSGDGDIFVGERVVWDWPYTDANENALLWRQGHSNDRVDFALKSYKHVADAAEQPQMVAKYLTQHAPSTIIPNVQPRKSVDSIGRLANLAKVLGESQFETLVSGLGALVKLGLVTINPGAIAGLTANITTAHADPRLSNRDLPDLEEIASLLGVVSGGTHNPDAKLQTYVSHVMNPDFETEIRKTGSSRYLLQCPNTDACATDSTQRTVFTQNASGRLAQMQCGTLRKSYAGYAAYVRHLDERTVGVATKYAKSGGQVDVDVRKRGF